MSNIAMFSTEGLMFLLLFQEKWSSSFGGSCICSKVFVCISVSVLRANRTTAVPMIFCLHSLH